MCIHIHDVGLGFVLCLSVILGLPWLFIDGIENLHVEQTTNQMIQTMVEGQRATLWIQ